MDRLEDGKRLEGLDSNVFFDIPQPDIEDPNEYRTWLHSLEEEWAEYNGNPLFFNCCWNEFGQVAFHGKVGGDRDLSCKLTRFDGTLKPMGENDFRAKRGSWFRDHYTHPTGAVVTVHFITDHFEEFLKEEGIAYTRENSKRRT